MSPTHPSFLKPGRPQPLPKAAGQKRASSSPHTFRLLQEEPESDLTKKESSKNIFHLYFLSGPPSGNIFYLATFAKQIEF